MHTEIEKSADALLMLLMLTVAYALLQADPLLPSLWAAATFFMTWLHR